MSKRKKSVAHAKPRWARINKNFLKWPVPRGDAYTALDHDLILNLLYDSQEQNRSRLEYNSGRDMLKRFGLGVGGRQHEELRRSLARLRRLHFEFDDWYVPKKKGEKIYHPDDPDEVDEFADDNDLKQRQAKKEMRRRNKPRYRKRSMGCLRGVRRRLDGRIGVALDPVFFKVNRAKPYHTVGHLRDARQLRTVAQKRLLLILRGWEIEKPLSRNIANWSKLLGMYDSNTARWRSKFLTAVQAVEAVRDGAVDVYEKRNGVVVVTPLWVRTGERGEHRLRGHGEDRHRQEIRNLGRVDAV